MSIDLNNMSMNYTSLVCGQGHFSVAPARNCPHCGNPQKPIKLVTLWGTEPLILTGYSPYLWNGQNLGWVRLGNNHRVLLLSPHSEIVIDGLSPEISRQAIKWLFDNSVVTGK